MEIVVLILLWAEKKTQQHRHEWVLTRSWSEGNKQATSGEWPSFLNAYIQTMNLFSCCQSVHMCLPEREKVRERTFQWDMIIPSFPSILPSRPDFGHTHGSVWCVFQAAGPRIWTVVGHMESGSFICWTMGLAQQRLSLKSNFLLETLKS